MPAPHNHRGQLFLTGMSREEDCKLMLPRQQLDSHLNLHLLMKADRFYHYNKTLDYDPRGPFSEISRA